MGDYCLILNTHLKGVLCSDGTQHSPEHEVYKCIILAILHVCYLLLFVYMLMDQMAYCMNKVSLSLSFMDNNRLWTIIVDGR